MNVTPPKSHIPIGTVMVAGVPLEVKPHPELTRFLESLVFRVGGVSGMDQGDLIGALLSGGQSDLTGREAMQGVDELRNELASIRSDLDMLRGSLEQSASEQQATRSVDDLRARVEQIEGRLL